MKITAAVARAAHADFTIEELELDAPRENEVLVRIVGVGICHSDLSARNGEIPTELPVVLGHEGAGIVEQIGAAVTSVQPGDHVVISFATCGECPACQNDQKNYCEAFPPLNMLGTRLDGSKALRKGDEMISSHFFGQSSFANYALAYESNVVKVRHDAPLELLGPLGCGVQTGAGTFMRAFACETGSSALVAGGGAVGLSGVLGAVVQGCHPIIVVEPHGGRRALALQLGATHTIDPLAVNDLSAAVREIVPHGVNYALDTTSMQPVLDGIFGALTAGGKLGIVGIPKNPEMKAGFSILSFLLGGYTVKGICEGDADPQELIPTMVDLYMAGKFPFDKMCQMYELADINKAVAANGDGSCVKAILRV